VPARSVEWELTMSLRGSAFVAIWNDVVSGREAEYDLWHNREHVPERVGVPGIIEGRRYVAPAGTRPAYFTLYDLASPDVLASAPYLELVREPSPRSVRMRPAFRNFVREPCRIVAAEGIGTGGAIATLRFEREPGAGEIPPASIGPTLTGLQEYAFVASLVLGEPERSGAYPIAGAAVESWVGGTRYVLLAEGTSRTALAAALGSIVEALTTDWGALEPILARTYDLALVVRHPGSGPRRPAQRSSSSTG